MSGGITAIVPTIPPRAAYLAAALQSVALQDRPPDQLLVEWDVAGYGAGHTRNRMVRMVSTEWIAFLDDDDWWYPAHLARLEATAEQTGADLVYPYPAEPQPLGWPIGKPPPLEDLKRYNFIPITYLVRSEAVQKLGGFPSREESPEGHEDWGLLQRLWDAGASFAHLPSKTWGWRAHDGQTGGRVWRAPAP